MGRIRDRPSLLAARALASRAKAIAATETLQAQLTSPRDSSAWLAVLHRRGGVVGLALRAVVLGSRDGPRLSRP